MTSEDSRRSRFPEHRDGTLRGDAAPHVLAVRCGAGVVAALLGLGALGALAAEPNYPFEGSWVRATRVCSANAPNVRTYTAHEVSFTTGHCSIRKVASGSGQLEIFEECRRAERPGNYTETIRMLSPDLMQVRRQAGRLKLARALRYTRCSIAAPRAAPPPMPRRAPLPETPQANEDHAGKPAEAPKP